VPAPSQRSHPLLGIALVAATTVCFAALDNTARYLGRVLPVLVFFWMRYLVQTVVMGVWLGWRRGRAGFGSGSPRFQLLRGTLLTVVSGLNFYGLQFMPAPEFTAIHMLAPLLVTVGAAALLKEAVSLAQRALVLGGFLGALLVVRPGSGVFGWAALFPIGSAVVYAGFQLLTRRMAATEPPATTHFWTGAVGLALVTPFLVAVGPAQSAAIAAAPIGLLGLAVLIGVLGTAGHLLLLLALGLAPAATLMPFLYLQIGLSTLLGAAVFAEWPDGWSFAGMAVIAASGATTAWLNLRGRPPPPPVVADAVGD
jgi:drug/metabolite transporter (DMT)-like permease